MDAINFFSIASQQNRWLSVRQSVVAQNIANVNTPGFKALDVQPFEAVLNSTGIEMRKTQESHLSPTSGTGQRRGDGRSRQVAGRAFRQQRQPRRADAQGRRSGRKLRT